MKMDLHAICLACLLIGSISHPALADATQNSNYDADMASLNNVATLINSTIAELNNGMSMKEARTALPHLQERPQWMRDTKVAAARIDTSHTLRSHSADSQRAQCIIMRAGEMDDTFQDVMVNVSMKARGAPDKELLPMAATPITSGSCR